MSSVLERIANSDLSCEFEIRQSYRTTDGRRRFLAKAVVAVSGYDFCIMRSGTIYFYGPSDKLQGVTLRRGRQGFDVEDDIDFDAVPLSDATFNSANITAYTNNNDFTNAELLQAYNAGEYPYKTITEINNKVREIYPNGLKEISCVLSSQLSDAQNNLNAIEVNVAGAQPYIEFDGYIQNLYALPTARAYLYNTLDDNQYTAGELNEYLRAGDAKLTLYYGNFVPDIAVHTWKFNVESREFDMYVEGFDTTYTLRRARLDFLKDNLQNFDPMDDDTGVNVDWYIDVTGEKEPVVKFRAVSSAIEQGILNTGTLVGVSNIGWLGDPQPDRSLYPNILFDTDYTTEVLKTDTMKDLYKDTDPNLLEQILSGLDIGKIVFYFWMDYGNGRHTTVVGAMFDLKGNCERIYIPSVNDGSTVNVNTSSKTDDYDDPIEDDDPMDDPSGENNLGLLTTTYKMTRSQCQALGAYLWGRDFLDAIFDLNSNPIENIVACKSYPYNIGGGTQATVVIGNVDTTVPALKLSTNDKQEMTVGTFSLPRKYNNFLDNAPYTSVRFFLPWVGWADLDPSEIYGKTVTVKYYTDIVTGACKVGFLVGGRIISTASGNIGIDIPLTGNNRAQMQVAQLRDLGGAISSVASGNIEGALSSGLSFATEQFHTQIKGSPQPLCDSFLPHSVYAIVTRPVVTIPSNYSHTQGHPCKLTGTLSAFSGYTEVGGNIDFQGFNCTDAEVQEIDSLLRNGVYL